MSNTSNKRARKGSKFWMQTIVNTGMKQDLNEKLGLDIHWISPLKEESYAEYKLNQNAVADLDIPPEAYRFWPSGQPQWDAIGTTKESIILVEAKAHLKELRSSLSATSPKSKELIESSMKAVQEKHYPKGDFTLWKTGYYQLANRLTFSHQLNDSGLLDKTVTLLFLNIVNDPTYISTTLSDWEQRFAEVVWEMTGLYKLPEGIEVLYFQV